MCCSKIKKACFFHEGEFCADKNIIYLEFDGNVEAYYYESWEKVNEKGRDEKMYRQTVKTKIEDNIVGMISKFEEISFMIHEGNKRHQYLAVKELKNVLSNQDILIHINISENYQCKYEREIQEVHFGGNRIQICLHIGIMYLGREKAQCFCIVSRELEHDPVAILCPLRPIPVLFHSIAIDSNIIIKYIVPLFKNFEQLSWNYTEAGQGKGVADAVGGTIKKASDCMISYGKDVAIFDQFVEMIQKSITNINITPFIATDSAIKEEIRKKAAQVRGIKILYFSFLLFLPSVTEF